MFEILASNPNASGIAASVLWAASFALMAAAFAFRDDVRGSEGPERFRVDFDEADGARRRRIERAARRPGRYRYVAHVRIETAGGNVRKFAFPVRADNPAAARGLAETLLDEAAGGLTRPDSPGSYVVGIRDSRRFVA